MLPSESWRNTSGGPSPLRRSRTPSPATSTMPSTTSAGTAPTSSSAINSPSGRRRPQRRPRHRSFAAGPSVAGGARARNPGEGRGSAMAKRHEAKGELLARVLARARDKLPVEQATRIEPFIRHYYDRVAPEDLVDRDVVDVYGAALAIWRLAQRRTPGSPKIQLLTPASEQHGLAVEPHGRGDRHRRHALLGGLRQHGAQPSWVRHSSHHPPGVQLSPRPGRPVARTATAHRRRGGGRYR